MQQNEKLTDISFGRHVSVSQEKRIPLGGHRFAFLPSLYSFIMDAVVDKLSILCNQLESQFEANRQLSEQFRQQIQEKKTADLYPTAKSIRFQRVERLVQELTYAL